MSWILNTRPLIFFLLSVQLFTVGVILKYTLTFGAGRRFEDDVGADLKLRNYDPFRKAVFHDHSSTNRSVINGKDTGNGTDKGNNTYRDLYISPTIWEKPEKYPAIGIQSFPSLPTIFPVPRLSSKLVPRLIKKDEYDTLMRLLNLSMSVLDEHNITYTLAYGSLIGSYLMHDMLPWDDDVDVFVHNSTKAQVMDLFKDDRHHGIRGVHHYKHSGQLFKLFFESSPNAGKYPWHWPFIDIVSYTDDTRDTFKAVERNGRLSWPWGSFFPQHLRPFGPLWMPVPKEPWTFMTKKYRSFKCKSSSWNHKGERGQKSHSGDCNKLVDSYPFVKRDPIKNITRETLVLNGRELYSIYVNEPYREQKSMFGW